MQTIRLKLGPRSYDIAIGSDAENGFAKFVVGRTDSRKFLVVADHHVRPIAVRLAGLLPEAKVVHVPAGESSKSLERLNELFGHLATLPADRKTPIIAVGGGVVGDLAGFAAATYNRGIPLFMVPTSLLAMVDSSVGGKVGINLPQGKNLVGAFHQPAGVWIDTALLATLPDREYRSGLAEVVKYGVILDEEFFAWIENHADAILKRESSMLEHLIARSCELKARVVEQDEREETGVRAVLNYGHTFAHAFESVSGYGTWLHGEAVAAGMIHASRLAEKRALISPELTLRQARLLERFGLPISSLSSWNVEAMLDVMRRDKKNVSGRMRFVLPTKLGRVDLFDDIPEAQVREALAIG